MKPNFLIILTDQQSSSMMGCAGNPHVQTPSMDRLARAGVRFTRCACTNPVCVPSRFSLLTGKMPLKIGMRANHDARNISRPSKHVLDQALGHVLRNAGYETVYGGKEHLPRFSAKDAGFDYICSDERDKLARISAEYLEKEHDRPFLLVVSLINPHDICYMAINDFKRHEKARDRKRWKKKLESRNVASILKSTPPLDDLPPLPGNHAVQEGEPGAIRDLFYREFREHARATWDERKWRQHRHVYAKLTEMVDSKVGLVLDALDRGPNAGNTVVIFTSDHGDHDGSHKLEHKTALYSEAVEVPFIIKLTGDEGGGKVVDTTISNGLDLFPTICDIAGIPLPGGLKGMSVLPLIESDTSQFRKWTPVESEIGKALWNDRWAYVVYDQGENAEQLYDLEADPGQTRNHVGKYPDVLDECRREFARHWPSSEI